MKDETHQARVAALSMAQCMTMVSLLRASGQNEHAENVEAAMNAVIAIVTDELGREALAQAMRWVSDQTGQGAALSESIAARH